ncbi:MAG: DNA helicase PcrA [Firmicutes bacterium]|nr:DNA helicase PcrA [Bacillota bacterium]
MEKYIESLNPVQREAVLHTGGPLLILAGAGSGKTRVLTCRVAHIIHNKRVSPLNILAVTFTNKAAGEMKDRIANYIGRNVMPWMGTFHSICARILRQDAHMIGFPHSFVIYDDRDQTAVVKECLKELQLEEKKFPPVAILDAISSAKNKLIGWKEFQMFAPSDVFGEVATVVYERYQDRLARNHAMDFDDLLMKTVELFQNFPEVLEKYREKFRYVHIDEYQDVNYTQYMLVKLLAEKHRNLCAVGDDDQSIYGFRGADITIILKFEEDYPEAKIIKLEQNYRSTKIILDAANYLVRNNIGRKDKTLWTANASRAKIIKYTAANEREEARFAITEIKKKVREREKNYGDFAILYRTNAQSRIYEEVLLQEGIPYKLVGGLRFYDRKEIKDILAYLKIIANPQDSVGLRRIINAPSRGIGLTTLSKLMEVSNSENISLYDVVLKIDDYKSLIPRAAEKIKEFSKLIKKLKERAETLSLTELVRHIIEDSGYKDALQTEGTIEAFSRLENIEELLSVTMEFEKTSEDTSLDAFLSEVSLMTDIDTWSEDPLAVTIMTLHSAKGLEFPVVIVGGMEEGIFPHSRSLSEPDQLEEERRLCYVGVTRARELLYLLNAYQRMLFGMTMENMPSRFLSEIPEEYLEDMTEQEKPARKARAYSRANEDRKFDEFEKPGEKKEEKKFKAGRKVRHRIFGEGVIKEVNGEEIKVSFKSEGEKLLLAEYLTPIDDLEEEEPGFRAKKISVGDRVYHDIYGEGVITRVVKGEFEKPVTAAFPGWGVQSLKIEEFEIVS